MIFTARKSISYIQFAASSECNNIKITQNENPSNLFFSRPVYICKMLKSNMSPWKIVETLFGTTVVRFGRRPVWEQFYFKVLVDDNQCANI